MNCEKCNKPSNLMVASKPVCWDCYQPAKERAAELEQTLREFIEEHGDMLYFRRENILYFTVHFTDDNVYLSWKL